MDKFKFISKENISKLSKEAGVYVLKNRNLILYIGKAANIRERAKNHFLQPTFRDDLFINQVSEIGYIKTSSEIEALLLEAKLIKKHQPKFNIMWRDDKNYFYVGLTEEAFPQIFITHQPRLQATSYKLEAKYVGPFVDGKALKETLKFLRKIFPFRSCRFLPKRSCLWYHLNRCPAPCLLKSKIMDVPGIKEKLEKEAQKDAALLFSIISGEKSQVLKNLKQEMKIAAKNQNFEKAQKIRDRIFALKKILSNARIFGLQISTPSDDWQKTENILRKIVGAKKGVSRIEAYDVSNIQGQEATGSMVAFIDGNPNKSFYRKFKIKIAGKPNDTAMIKEILSRRLKHEEWGWPDLVLIDGGKGQLNAALKIKNYKSELKILSLAKKKNELFIEGKKNPLLLKNLPNKISNLILHLRDEAHRFAISYHKKLREIDLLPKT
ncbi:MAG: UvrB/UvrC motif-containing protein [Parcubacteria group bacterium]